MLIPGYFLTVICAQEAYADINMIISQNRISFVDKKETFNNNHCCGFFLSYIEFFFFSSKEKDRLKPKKKEKNDPMALKEREVWVIKNFKFSFKTKRKILKP